MNDFEHFVTIKTYDREIKEEGVKKQILYVNPTWNFNGTDLMKKGGKFYAVLDRDSGMWSQNEILIYKIIDDDVRNYISATYRKDGFGFYRSQDGKEVRGLYCDNSESGKLLDFKKWFGALPDNHNYVNLDSDLTFKSTKVTPDMYRSKRLPYDIQEGPTEGYDRLMTVLYSPENRQKLEWAVGSVLSGDSKHIDKMVVIYSYPGFGKSTILNIIRRLFTGYCATFKVDDLVSGVKQFATAAFKDNPLVAIHGDGSLKKVESPVINELVSHEEVMINEKNKAQYVITSNAMLFVATNDLVDLHDTRVGLTRRMLDVYPTMQKLPVDEYWKVVEQIKFETSHIAYHCLNVYKSLGKSYYEGYIPIEMISKTNYLQNFFSDNLEVFSKQAFFTRDTLYSQFCAYCNDSGLGYAPKRIPFTEQLREYFKEHYERKTIDGVSYRHVFMGLKIDKILGITPKQESKTPSTWIDLKEQPSILDELYSEQPAQYATSDGKLPNKWVNVKTKLGDIDTHKLHWFKLPESVIKIDFDIHGPDGEKSLEENIKAASIFPPTYCEVSKSGGGLHLYYIYTGDVNELSRLYADNVEVKVSTGNNSHRRLLTLCNDRPIAAISDGLPLKEEKKKVVNGTIVTTEKGLRTTIEKCLSKKVHPDTTSNVDYIYKILDDAYNSDVEYDLSDMFRRVYEFAAHSTNQSERCKDKVLEMHFKSKDKELEPCVQIDGEEGPLIIFDIEVFPNLLLVCWCYAVDDPVPVVMFNPTSEELSEWIGLNKTVKPRLIGFNNRSYDNHIIYGRILGDSIYQCYQRSNLIINGEGEDANGARLREAYNLSYADVYDFASEKKSLKKWEYELQDEFNTVHQENAYDWDKPIPEEHWAEIADYCKNDVLATKAVFDKCQGDYICRQILADLSGLSVNDTNRQHITRILVGTEKKPNHVYTNLATGVAFDSTGMPVPLNPNIINSFPGYEYRQNEKGKWINWYRDTDVGRGGYVYAEPGMYTNVALLDVGNMHGASILALNKFGEHTKNYQMIRNARMAIKHRDREALSKIFDGRLLKYLDDDEMCNRLDKTLKLILNSTYGIAEAGFENPLKDPRDKCNTIALRGALFMRTLQDEVQSRGFQVIHIKTDSIKIPNATDEIISFVMDFGKKYGYEFEHEATYERICLVNDAVYIAKYDSKGIRNKGGKHAGEWTATGTEFQVPYVFKTLFSKEPIIFKDKCEIKSCTTAFVLDYNENLPEGEHDYRFVGKVGKFCPMKPGAGGGVLYRTNKIKENYEESGRKVSKYAAATGTSGYRWLESSYVRAAHKENDICDDYYRNLVDNAIAHISEFGDFEWFVNGDVNDDHYVFDVA